MMWTAWLGALAIGLALGLLGAGGSILTVPVLVYVVGQPQRVAIASSLAIVGIISLAGALSYIRRKQISWPNVVFFGVPGMVGTYGGAWLSAFVSPRVQLVLFAVVMILAAGFMLHPVRLKTRHAMPSTWKIGLDGFAVGVLTGFVGVGGGFLIIPALVLLGGLTMHAAVGTSLLIIALKSLAGLYKYMDVLHAQGMALDWRVITMFSLVGTIGSIGGSFSSHLISENILKRVFGLGVIVMALFILWNNLGTVPR